MTHSTRCVVIHADHMLFWTKILAARRLERLEELKADLEARYGVTVTVAQLDLCSVDSCDAFYASIPEDLRDNVDVLVNNAGVGARPRPVYAVEWDDFERVIDTNVKGVVKMIKLFVPGMLKRQVGHIINISSTVGKASTANLGVYCGSKHMLEAINTALRSELVATPLRVSMVSPGITKSEFADTAIQGDGSAFYAGFQALDSEDLAEDIVYVASRPPHVQVVDLHTTSTAQASLFLTHRTNTNGASWPSVAAPSSTSKAE